MKVENTGRFKDAPWFPKEETYVLVGGAGGIGSWLTVLLARANFLPLIYDFDDIEEHNIGGQLYGNKHVGMQKVQALQTVVKEFTETTINTFNEKYTKDSMSNHYVFAAFDNMQARKDMFEAWCNYVKIWQDDIAENDPEMVDAISKVQPIFIDGRLTMEQLQIFCVTPDKIEAYKEHLFDDSEVEDAPCTLKQTSHSAAMIASHMVGFFTNHMTNNAVGDIDRNIPFKYEYFIPINYTNEE